MLKVKLLSNFAPIALIFFLLATINFQMIVGRVDCDTDEINTSFKGQIEFLFSDPPCNVSVGGTMVPATAKVNDKFKMPTCLLEFYNAAHMRACGKPMYNKFAYCAKALHFGNKDRKDLDIKEKEMHKKKQLLVLIDGCVQCPYWPDKASNVTIELKLEDELVAKTVSDAYGDYKIGGIFKWARNEDRQLQPKLEVTNFCNQYGHRQKQILPLPVQQVFKLDYMMFESKATNIFLPQHAQNEYTIRLINDGKEKGSKPANSTADA